MSSPVQRLEDLIVSLFDCASSYGGSDQLRNEVADSVKTIGTQQPNTMLSASHQYLLQNPKCTPSHKAFVFRNIESVLAENRIIDKVDEQLALLIINLATQEMTMSKENDSEWSDCARDVLVTLAKSRRFVTHVLDALLQKFPPGITTSPHRYIVLTMSTIAEHNPVGLMPFLTDILSRAVPLMPLVKSESLRCVWAHALYSFCEAVRECETERAPEALEGGSEENGIEESPRPKSESGLEVYSRDTYADQIEAIYDVVFQWMYSKDPKTRAEACQCVGELCLLIRPSKVSDDVKKLVTTMLGLYKKAYTEQHLITMGVCRFLEATCNDENSPMEPYLEEILNALFPNACVDADDSTVNLNTLAIKNHSEAFRCFHVAAMRFADLIVYYLLHKMQSTTDLQKLGAINVLRHLINSSGKHMDDKKSLVMMGLKKILVENTSSIRVKRAMVQLCVALADHSYVDAEGGDQAIAFLVRHLVPPLEQELPAKRIEIDVAGSNQLRTQCAQALYTISSTCTCANKLMWPYLFKFICSDRYFPVVADICKCLKSLIIREREEGHEPDFVTGFNDEKVAGKHAVFARLFTSLCNAPLNGFLSRRAREAGGLLCQLASWFHPHVVTVLETWSTQMEPLMDELCSISLASPSSESPAVEVRGKRIARWHEACLDWLTKTVASVTDGDWRTDIASAMAKQLELCKDLSEEKAFLLRCLGIVLSKIVVNAFVIEHIMLMFKCTQHSSAVERQGCARGIGLIASIHTDLVLVELENISKWEHAKRSTGLFGFIKGAMPMSQYTDVDAVNVRATLMLSYGYVVSYCVIDSLPQHLQHTIIPYLRHYFANVKQEVVVREAMLETMRLIAVAAHPSHIGGDYKLEVRDELLTYVKDYVQNEVPEMLTNSLRLLAAKAAAALVSLDPVLSDKDILEIAGVLTQCILPMCREKSGLKTLAYDLFDFAASSISTFTSPYPTTSAASAKHKKMDDDESATIMDATVCQYGLALEALIKRKPTVATATTLLKMLQPYYSRAADHERARSVEATVLILRVYYENANDISLGHASDFGPLSSLLARLSPRLCDSLAVVRLHSVAAIYWSLRLAHVHKGHLRGSESTIFSMESFVEEFSLNDGRLEGQTAKRAIKTIAEIVEQRLPQSQIQMYLSALFEMLLDRQSQVSSGAAQLLTYSLTTRGSTLINEADTLVTTMLAKLVEVHTCVQTYTDLLAAIMAFAVHQQQIVCEVMLRQPLPYTLQISDTWECLCRDRWLFASNLDYLLEMLSNALDLPFDVIDTGAGSSAKVVHQEPCQYVAAIDDVVKSGEIDTLQDRIPITLSALFEFICSVSDTQFPVVQKESKDGVKLPLIITPELRRSMEKPVGLAVSALKTLLTKTRCPEIVEDMNVVRAWSECLDKELFIDSLTVLTRSIANHRSDWISMLVKIALERADNEREPIRLAAVIIVSSLIKVCRSAGGNYDEGLIVKCIRRLEKSLEDPSLRVRKFCVRGLGELAECSDAAVIERFINIAVEAAMSGLDDHGDRKDMLATESILALNKLVSETDDAQLLTILPSVLLKIRPCFEKASPFLRAAAFSLFADLGARVGAAHEDFLSHLQTNIITVLLHLNEESDDVKKEATKCLVQLHKFFNVDIISSFIERELEHGRLVRAYPLFVKDFAQLLVCSFPDLVNQYALTCSNYYKSCNAPIRANSCLLIGSLLGALTPQLRSTISRELIFSGLVQLLKDPEDALVRVAAIRAISCLKEFS